MTNTFSQNLLLWYEAYGRHDLPWQKDQTHYRVWISEIMLQQTQVSTVISYYEHFMQSFPSVFELAKSSEDKVLAHWSGLGYYARARNIHKAAKMIVNNLKGVFPTTVEAMCMLPGIGQSTAGAIISFAQKEKAVILDGNVKRVLSRYFAIDDPKKDLWPLATMLTPDKRAHHYNQAIMDLGATLCTRSKPRCSDCPVKQDCKAFQENTVALYPIKTEKKARPVKNTTMLILQNTANEILLMKRPAKGIWGGLWSLPEHKCECQCECEYTLMQPNITLLNPLTHQFTHFTLIITPIVMKTQHAFAEKNCFWYKLGDALPGGIAAPVAKLLIELQQTCTVAV